MKPGTSRKLAITAVVVIFLVTCVSCMMLPHPDTDPGVPEAEVTTAAGESVAVESLDYEWTYWDDITDAKTTASVVQVDSYDLPAKDVPSVSVAEGERVTVRFELPAEAVEARSWSEKDIELRDGTSDAALPLPSLVRGIMRLGAPAEETVPVELVDGAAELVAEPGRRYEVIADFEAGTAEYAFSTRS